MRAPDGTITEFWRFELTRGRCFLLEGRHDEAEACFERAHQAAPERAEVAFALGRERMRRGKLDEAERLLRAAWVGDPSLPASAAALARCLGLSGPAPRVADAHRVVEEALARHPSEPGLYIVRAELLLVEDRVDEAFATLERADGLIHPRAVATRAALKLSWARTHVRAGTRLVADGRAEEALFSFKRAADLAPGWAEPLVEMGRAFHELGRLARARSSWERALVLDPQNVAAARLLAESRRQQQPS